MELKDLRTRAGGLAQSAAKKTRQAAESAKRTLEISQEQEKIKRAYQELGKLYARDYETQIAPEGAEYTVWLEKLAASRQKIAALKGQIGQIDPEPEDAPAPATDLEFVVVDEDDPDPEG